MPGLPAARAGGAEALAMPGLPSARAAGAAEALVLRAAERSLKDVLELVNSGALDPSTLGSLSGLCEELKRTSVPRVVDAADAGDDDEADTETEDPARPSDGTVTPIRFAAPAPRPRRRKLGDGGEAALALGALRLSTKPMDAAWTSRGAKRNPEREPVESESDADADAEDASRVKRRRERLCSPTPDRSGATTPPPVDAPTLPDPAAARGSRWSSK